jgi:hypothetical protein
VNVYFILFAGILSLVTRLNSDSTRWIMFAVIAVVAFIGLLVRFYRRDRITNMTMYDLYLREY